MESGFNRATVRGVIVEVPQLKKGCVFFTLAWMSGHSSKINYVKCALFGTQAVDFAKTVAINSAMVIDGYLDTVVFTSYVGVRIIVNSYFLQHGPSQNNAYVSQMYQESVTNKLKRDDYNDTYLLQ
jgi:hypothetical protein